MRDMTDEVLAEARYLHKENKKLQQKLTLITNCMIGNQRIWVLDRLAMELEVEADIIKDSYTDETPHAMSSNRKQRMDNLRADVLFLRRLEWDLGELHVAVRGDTNRRGGRYDQAEWKGSRP